VLTFAARTWPLKLTVVGEFAEKYPPIRLRFVLEPEGTSVFGNDARTMG
jgi:hypothetical protein